VPDQDPSTLVIEPLDDTHDLAAFRCGQPSLDEYLRRYAGQNQKRGIGRTFVACDPSNRRAVGYHTIAAGAVRFTSLPEAIRRRLPRYPIPVAHLGRLAVDETWQGRRLGERLLIDALTRVVKVADRIAIHAVEVVAIDDSARTFYERYGFTPLIDDPRHLYLPLQVLRKLGLSR
jgi:GNAT superfamily N-acetyltransferase